MSHHRFDFAEYIRIEEDSGIKHEFLDSPDLRVRIQATGLGTYPDCIGPSMHGC